MWTSNLVFSFLFCDCWTWSASRITILSQGTSARMPVIYLRHLFWCCFFLLFYTASLRSVLSCEQSWETIHHLIMISITYLRVCIIVGVSWLFNIPAMCKMYLRDSFACCHTDIKVADKSCYLTQSVFYPRPTSPSIDPVAPGPGMAATRVPTLKNTGVTQLGKAGFDPQVSCFQGGPLVTRPLMCFFV